MRRFVLIASCLLLHCIASGQSVSSDQAWNDFRTQILKHRLILKSFSADAVTNYAWQAKGLSVTPPKMRTLGVFTPDSVNLHNDSLELTGRRSTFRKDQNGKQELIGDEPVVLMIALNGTEPTQIAPTLKSQLFFPTLEAAIEGVPLPYRQFLSLTGDPPSKDSLRPANCPAQAKFQRPSVVSAPDAEFTDEAYRAHLKGFLSITITVDEAGHPSDLWLGKPASQRFEEQAVKALSGYIFKPATCNGLPVKSVLTIIW